MKPTPLLPIQMLIRPEKSRWMVLLVSKRFRAFLTLRTFKTVVLDQSKLLVLLKIEFDQRCKVYEAFWFSEFLWYKLLGQDVGGSSKSMLLHRCLFGVFLVPSCNAFSSGCLFLSRCYRDTCVPHPRVRGRHYDPIRKGCSSCMNSDVPEKLQEANLKAHISLWETRRSMTRGTLYAAKTWRNVREFASGPSNDAQEEGDSLADDGRGALIVSAVALAVAAATLRVGGRAALMSVSVMLKDASNSSDSRLN